MTETPDTRYIRNGHYMDAANGDADPDTAEDWASGQLADAHAMVSRLRQNAHRFPELAAVADELDKLADRAEAYEDARDEARTAVRVAEAERNAAGRVAIRDGRDPVEAERNAAGRLADAREDAERAERHWHTAAALASGEASRARARIQRLNKEHAGEILTDALVALDDARTAALDAAQDARRKLGVMHAYVLHVRAAANLKPDSDLAKLAHTGFHPDSAARGSNRPTYNGVLHELDNMAARLAYTEPSPFSSDADKLGSDMGRAVAMAREQKTNTHGSP
ncbi:hypothetical protein [Nocardiopsis sp. TNDT3]|uniref:hypothetical protein n=1 Tax=Nocardiopsis sp. TNDT3 TaxID=2249354 RepID=UPI000E3BABF7|nr:hypothetical protein [Nocardiopsis sp. TNDT3]